MLDSHTPSTRGRDVRFSYPVAFRGTIHITECGMLDAHTPSTRGRDVGFSYPVALQYTVAVYITRVALQYTVAILYSLALGPKLICTGSACIIRVITLGNTPKYIFDSCFFFLFPST